MNFMMRFAIWLQSSKFLWIKWGFIRYGHLVFDYKNQRGSQEVLESSYVHI